MSVVWRCAVREGLIRSDIADEDVKLITRRLTPGLVGYAVMIMLGLVGYAVMIMLGPVPASAGGVGPSHHRGVQPDTHSRCPKARDRGLKALRLEGHCQSRCGANTLVRFEGDGRDSPPPGDAY